MDSTPNEPPPSYEVAAASGPSTHPPNTRLEVPHRTRSGIPIQARRSMEDEARPLPAGWVRQFDQKSSHQFFVDTTAKPPRSIWCHPYDDRQYLDSLDPKERQRVLGLHRVPTKADMEAESSEDDEGHHNHQSRIAGTGTGAASAALPPRNDQPSGGLERFGRKMKDKITGSTHEQREAQRRQREEEERQAYERHQMLRRAMIKAADTGEPQLVGKDKNGKDIYIEPPQGGNVPGDAYGYNPYRQGPYGNPNATYVRPSYGYSRPYGGGYGGGYGLPLAGGLMGGLLLGDMMGGGLGMGGMGMGMGGMGMGGGMMF